MDIPQADGPKDRYPGLRSFSSHEQNLFFGRKKEINDLVDLVRAEQLIVLFSKSGLGKSSLLNAGLAPKLTALHYRVIPVRFQKLRIKTDETDTDIQQPTLSDNALLNIVLTQLEGEFQEAWKGQEQPDTNSPFYDASVPRLWEEVKTHPFPNGAVPVFIFDQFEELFIYNQAQRDDFIRQLAELMNDQAPVRIMQWLLQTDVDDRTLEMMNWSKQPSVKCLFAIRADRLFEMHKMRAVIPTILRNRYELLALEDDRVREAIDRPAQADGLFTTPPFTYMPATRELIIRVLSGRANKNKQLSDDDDPPCEIESSQLQIVCNYVEKKIKEKVAKNEEAVVGPDIIRDEESIDRILDKFYRTQLKSVGSPDEIEKVRQVLEDDLIVDGHRVGLAAAKMRKRLGDDQTADRLIDKLIEVRLIRADDTHLGRTYELSHDTLIEPVEKVKQLRIALQQRMARRKEAAEQLKKIKEQEAAFAHEEKQRKLFQRLTFFILILAAIATTTTFFALNFLIDSRTKLADANTDWAADEYDAGNHRMAYRLWESSQNLVFWITRANKLWEETKLLVRGPHASTATSSFEPGAHLWAPFAGDTVLFFVRRDSVVNVASMFQDNSFEVWKSAKPLSPKEGTRYEKIDSLMYTSVSGNTVILKSATLAGLQGNHLAVLTDDSLLQVFDIVSKQKIFPQGQDYFHCRSINKPGAASERTTVLSPKGKWLAVLAPDGRPELYKLAPGTLTKNYLAAESVDRNGPFVDLNRLTFSPGEDALVIQSPVTRQVDLIDLSSTQTNPVRTYATVSFSQDGTHMATASLAGQLDVYAVGKTKKRLVSVSLPAVNIAQVVFAQTDSTLLVVTGGVGKYELFRIDFTEPGARPKSIAANINSYRLFDEVGYVLYTNGQATTSYSVATKSHYTLPQRFNPDAIVKMGKTHVLYRATSSPLPKTSGLYLYDAVTRKDTPFGHALGNHQQVALYGPAGGSDETLIQADSMCITFFSLKGSEYLTYTSIALGRNAQKNRFLPASLTIEGPLLTIKNQAGVRMCFFASNGKNKLDYLARYIYPPLSPGDKDAAGLLD